MRDGAVAPDNSVYAISEIRSGGVYHFNASGPLPDAWDNRIGPSIFGGKALNDVRLDSTGALLALVGDYSFDPSTVLKYDSTGKLLGTLSGGLTVRAFTVGAQDELYLSTTTGLVITDKNGKPTRTISRDILDGYETEGLAVTGDGTLYAAMNTFGETIAVKKLSPAGVLIDSWPVPAGVRDVSSIAVAASGEVFLYGENASFDPVVTRFSSSGEVLNQWTINEFSVFEPRIRVDPLGNPIVNTWLGFTKYSPQGELLARGSNGGVFTVAPNGTVVVCSTGPDQVAFYSQAATRIRVNVNREALPVGQSQAKFQVVDTAFPSDTSLQGTVSLSNNPEIP